MKCQACGCDLPPLCGNRRRWCTDCRKERERAQKRIENARRKERRVAQPSQRKEATLPQIVADPSGDFNLGGYLVAWSETLARGNLPPGMILDFRGKRKEVIQVGIRFALVEMKT